MNRILAICHSLSPVGLNGVNVFLRSLVQTFTMERFASIHILHTNEAGPVMHLHTQKPVAEIRDRRLIIKTIKGCIPAVVHQYDRYPNLQKAVYTMYGVGA